MCKGRSWSFLSWSRLVQCVRPGLGLDLRGYVFGGLGNTLMHRHV